MPPHCQEIGFLSQGAPVETSLVFLDSVEHIYFPAGTEQCIVRHRFLEHCVSPRAEEPVASFLSVSIVSIYTPHLKLLRPSLALLIATVLCVTNTDVLLTVYFLPLGHLNISTIIYRKCFELPI